MNTQHDPTYELREDDPAQHVAVDGDLLDVRLLPDTDTCDGDDHGDWRQFCGGAPLTPDAERAFWIRVACTVAAKRDALAAAEAVLP